MSGIYGLCGKRDFRRDDMPAVIVPVSLCIAYQCVCGIQRWCVKRFSGVDLHTVSSPASLSIAYRCVRVWVVSSAGVLKGFQEWTCTPSASLHHSVLLICVCVCVVSSAGMLKGFQE